MDSADGTTQGSATRMSSQIEQCLADRIEMGNRLLAKQIYNSHDLSNARLAFTLWHDYNTESLGMACEGLYQTFADEYLSHLNSAVAPSSLTFKEGLEVLHADIRRHLAVLNFVKERFSQAGNV